MLMSRITIAIDGPAGAGKSTIAKQLAERFDLMYLDTGAMYRCLGLKALRQGISVDDDGALAALLADTRIGVLFRDGKLLVTLDEEDVSQKIRTPEVSAAASAVSRGPQVREAMVERQRSIAGSHAVVMDGRDIGTNVLPNAGFKFYLVADVMERAKRRQLELDHAGKHQPLETIAEDIRQRDAQDMSRAHAPLCKAADAVEIDTTALSIEQVTAVIADIVEGKA